MPRHKRLEQATLLDTLVPPTILPPTQRIARFESATGKNLYNVTLPSNTSASQPPSSAILVEMPAKFRSTVWLKRGGFVVVELKDLKADDEERDNKIAGEIVNVVGDEKAWRKASWWPREFAKNTSMLEQNDDDNGQGRVGEIPSSNSEGDE